MKNRIWIYVVFFSGLLLVFYAFVFKGYDFSKSNLKVINASVPAFTFTNQDGKKITQADTDDKVYVVEYFFTTCKGICPRMNANMRRVFDVYQNQKDFLILSHTCMPETDSVSILKMYEQKMLNGRLVQRNDGSYKIDSIKSASISHTNWNFLTGDKTELYRMARNGYMVDNGKPDSSQIKDQFIHTQFFALVDRYRRVRGIYDGLKEDEIQKLILDIKGLLKERIDHTRFMSGFSNSPT